MDKEEARVYHEISKFQYKDGLKLLDILSPQSNGVVLDIGCGTGRLSKILSDRLVDGRVVGVDPDEERIKIAMDEGKGRTNLQFMVGSDQTFPEDQYDMVICTDAIHWIKNKSETFNQVYANLKPGGKFGFTTLANGIPDIVIEIAQLCGTQAFDAVMNSTHYEDGNYYKQLASQVGFSVLYFDARDVEYTLPSIDAFVDFYYSVYHGMFDRTDPNLIGIKERYGGQAISWTMQRLFVVMTKPV
ncbi:PREDICTED: uncharacterized protein LOC105313965 [Amphimedon queenslandica]|uniref:Methyltransferase type 11 domain-containing protein n=1 Tax=Amphimedon queenslandica TaxID=400682 RepID=A0A1X7U4E3_AMPQE|nr:PREDICTED: uncharacterized protein LOC105313965 [Amphimedon queenslandica]|eukprot:XP_011406111.1 PREDICTED: uncharacterized protein LOC105313965 [Amphimedon queenslandica]